MRVIDYKTYWIAHNRKDVVHYGYNEPPAKMETGQPYLEEFDNEEDWEARLRQLGVEGVEKSEPQ